MTMAHDAARKRAVKMGDECARGFHGGTICEGCCAAALRERDAEQAERERLDAQLDLYLYNGYLEVKRERDEARAERDRLAQQVQRLEALLAIRAK